MGMNLSLDIDYELADRITVVNLKDCYERIGNELRDLAAIEKIQPYQVEDMEHAIANRVAIRKVLCYFMTHLEAEEYFNGKEND
jgi:hypothetical protein